MFQNYLKSTLRNLSKNRLYTFINSLGLTVGMTCFILIAFYLQYELSYDQQHEKVDQIYRIAQQQKGNAFRGSDQFATTPLVLTASLMEAFPEVEAATTIQLGNNLLTTEKDKFRELGLYADEWLFDVFTIPVVAGEGRSALKDPNSILLTAALAQKYFGNTSPIGETIKFGEDRLLTVKGVIEDVPKNQHFTYDYILSLQNWEDYANDVNDLEGGWISNNYKAYLRLAEGHDYKVLEEKMHAAFSPKIQSALNYVNTKYDLSLNIDARFFLQQLTDIHLYSDINFEIGRNNSIWNIYFFASIGLIILLLATINYMNLATVRSARRFKEVGVRKVLGANKRQLIGQLLGESFLMTFLSLGLAVALVYYLLPTFGQLVTVDIPFLVVGNQWIFVGMLLLALLIGGLSGLYPSLVLSKVNPVKAFRGMLSGASKKGRSLRNVLVTGQFVAAIVLGTGGLIVYSQLQYIQNKKLGYNRDQIAFISYAQEEVNEKSEVIRTELLKHPKIQDVSFTRTLPLNNNSQGVVNTWEGNPSETQLPIYRFFVDHNYLDVFEIELVEGQNFAPNTSTDTTAKYILNQSAVKAIGWESAVGKQFRDGQVVGVVKDFHFQPFDLRIEPLYMTLHNNSNRSRFGRIALKMDMEEVESTLAYLQNTMKTILPQYSYDVQFLDEAYQRMYESEQRIGKAFNIFTLLALFIACMGLFGLMSHQVLQRTKEIGIRKVLGASVSSLVALLSKDFLQLIIIAFVIAIPITYYAMNQWLENFAYRIHISWWVFALTGFGAIGVALLTVSVQSVKAALVNPVKNLRNE
ncbi:MAG: ABC transporter permease [Bacteroidota bacterium]